MKIRYILVLAFLMLPFFTKAQDYETITEPFSTGGRFSGELEWDLGKGVRVYGEEEVRFKDNFNSFSKSYSTFGFSYKPVSFLKMDAGYSFIYQPKKNRNRVMFSVTGSMNKGNWNFSLKEKIQMTGKSYDFNHFQQPLNLVQSKLTLKADYDIPHSSFAPYVAAELRHTLNGVDTESLGKTNSEAGNVSYSNDYIDRIRFTAGTEWRLNRNNYLDLYAFVENTRNFDIDASFEGKFKSACWVTAWVSNIGIAYKFSIK